MAWKNINQHSFADDLLIEHESIKELDSVDSLIEWKVIEQILSHIHAYKAGEKAWPPVLMFKCLLLQVWYNLSDPALEKSLARDLMFRRFSGLGLSESVPDHSTFWRFRNLLEQESLYQPLLEEINKQMQRQGFIIKQGEVSIIDASVIKAKQNRPRKGKDGNNTQDAEAAYKVKTASDGKRKTTYGFKTHINTDEDGFIKSYQITAGNVHDSKVFEILLTGSEKEAYADSAYKSEKHDQMLRSKGIKNSVLERAYRNKPLNEEQKKNNCARSQTRTVVERTFGVLKLHYGMGTARYLGIARNSARFAMMSIAHNMKRGLAVQMAS